MSLLLDIGVICLGLLLIGGSGVLADAFTPLGGNSLMTRLSGLGDGYNSRLYRWAAAVLTGLLFVAAGVADLFSK
jgi:hypothetical protein